MARFASNSKLIWSLKACTNSAPTGNTCLKPFGTSPLGLSGEMKKWLSYREQPVLGRALMMAEIMAVTAMAKRLAALVLLQATLEANYKSMVAATWAFSKAD